MKTLAVAVIVLLACSACSSDNDAPPTESATEQGLSFAYPRDWSSTPFSDTNDPHRLAIASYDIPADSVEGDCGGSDAVRRLPRDGALVLLIDYGDGPGFEPLPDDLELTSGTFAQFDCFGASTQFRFRVGERDLQAHVAFGPVATDETRRRALDVLRSVAAG